MGEIDSNQDIREKLILASNYAVRKKKAKVWRQRDGAARRHRDTILDGGHLGRPLGRGLLSSE